MITSGLVALKNSVQSYFTARGVTANVSLGWKQPAKNINEGPGGANRVVFIPSDPTGKGGKLVGTQQPGPRQFGNAGSEDTAARALFDWERYIVVSVWAVDASDPHNEEKQIEAVETLFEWVLRAVQYAAKNNARWGDVAWMTSPTEQMFGRELRAGLVFRHPMFDVETGVAHPSPKVNKGSIT